MASAPCVAPDWASLPSDLVAYISKSVTFFDFLAFRSVCRSWADAMRGVRPSPHAPYLLLADDDSEHSERFTFLSVADGIAYRRAVPGLCGKYCVGSQHGWLAVVDADSALTLLNPATGEEIHLPPTTGHPFLEIIPQIPATSFRKVVLSANPSAAGEFTVAALFSNRLSLAFTTSGEQKWHFCKGEVFQDLLFHDGTLLGIDGHGYLQSIHIDGSKMEKKAIAKQFRAGIKYTGRYLAVNEVGRLMFVWRLPDFHRLVTVHIEACWLDSEKMSWVRAKKLDGHALFIGKGSSMLLSAREALGVMANHAYFTDDWDMISYSDTKTRQCDVGVFSLEDQSVQPCQALDSLFSWPPPIWFLPELPPN